MARTRILVSMLVVGFLAFVGIVGVGVIRGAQGTTQTIVVPAQQGTEQQDSSRFVGCGSGVYVTTDGSCPRQQTSPTPTPVTVSTGAGNREAITQQTDEDTAAGLDPATVLGWCSGSCGRSRFEQLTEANGFVNPDAVHFRTGNPVSFAVPAGYFGEGWDCVHSFTFEGPTQLPTVCEASFRRS
jgi:hypothetical protein